MGYYIGSIGLALAAKKKAEEEKKAEPTPSAPRARAPEPLTQEKEMQFYKSRKKAVEERQVESQRFYEEAGYPQYAGKYEAPEVPEGFKVKAITETKKGLSIQYQYVGKPRNITEMFMTWQPTVLGFQLPAKKTLKEAEVSRFTAPGRMVGGLVSAVEAPVYSVGRLVGFETPPIPVTVSGGLIGSGIQTFWGEKGFQFKPTVSTELGEAFRHPEYAFGSIVGDIGLSYLVGKGVEKFVVQPIKTSRVGTEIGYQFKQHAPERVLKLVYGKQMGTAIAVERQWSWGKPVAKGTAGMLEESFGMPFYRAETLRYAMPTKEWARVGFTEWMASRRAIESQLKWTLGVSPAYGISTKTLLMEGPTGLSSTEKMAQAEQMPVYKIQKEMMLSLHEGKLEQKIFEKWTIPTGKKTISTYRGAFEFEQSTKMAMPSRLFTPTPAKIKLKMFRGFQTTPFEQTLMKAIEKETALKMGGLTVSQLAPSIQKQFLLQPPSPLTFYKAPTRLYGKKGAIESFMGAPQLIFPRKTVTIAPMLGLGVISAPKPFIKEITRLGLSAKEITTPAIKPIAITAPAVKEFVKQAPIVGVVQELGTKTVQIQEQMQKQVQQQTQIQFEVSKTSITKLTGKPPKLWTPDFLKAKRRRKRKKKKLKGEWWLRTWPVKRSVFLPKSYKLNGGREKSLELKLEL